MNSNDADSAKRRLEEAVHEGDPDAIARTIVDHGWPLFASHYDLTVGVVAALPTAVTNRYPALRLMHPVTQMISPISPELLRPMIDAEDTEQMDADELDAALGVQMVTLRHSGDIAAAMERAVRLRDRLLHLHIDSHERADGVLWYIHLQIGNTMLAGGESIKALMAFSTARQIAAHSDRVDGVRLTLSRIALARAIRGSHGDAAAALASARTLAAPAAAFASACTTTENATAALLAVDAMADDLDETLLALEGYDSIEVSWPFSLLARTRAGIARQHPEDALEMVLLAGDTHHVQEGSFAWDVLTSAEIEARAAMGQETITPRMRQAITTDRPGLLTRLAVVRLALHEGNLRAAEMGIRELRRDDRLGPTQRAEVTTLGAWLEFLRTDGVDAPSAAQLLRIAETGRQRRLFSSLPRQLLDTVRAALGPEEAAIFAQALAGLPVDQKRIRPRLTRSEVRVLRALTTHTTTARIASVLQVSPNTVKSQLRSIYRKLGCSTRDDVVNAAIRLQLIDSPRRDARPPISSRVGSEAVLHR